MLSEISANIQYHHIHEKYVLYIYIYIKREILINLNISCFKKELKIYNIGWNYMDMDNVTKNFCKIKTNPLYFYLYNVFEYENRTEISY